MFEPKCIIAYKDVPNSYYLMMNYEPSLERAFVCMLFSTSKKNLTFIDKWALENEFILITDILSY